MVQGARGPRHFLHEVDGPQAPRSLDRILRRPTYGGCGGYTADYEVGLQRIGGITPVHQYDGSSAA